MYDNLLPYTMILIWSGIDAKQIIVWLCEQMYALLLHHETFVLFCSFDICRLCIRHRTKIVVNYYIKLSRIQYIMAVYIFKNFIMLSVPLYFDVIKCIEICIFIAFYIFVSFYIFCIFLYLLYLFIAYVSYIEYVQRFQASSILRSTKMIGKTHYFYAGICS